MSASDHTSELREPLVTQDRTYGEMTKDVMDSLEKKSNPAWKIAFAISLILLLLGVGTVAYQIAVGDWNLGAEQNYWLVLGYYQFCVLGRNWSRRNLNFCDSFAISAKMENFNQQSC